jgi:hypothetical protein
VLRKLLAQLSKWFGKKAWSSVATRPRSRRIGMAGKSKKHRVPNPVSLGTEAKAPMLSLKVKKQKKTSRGK